MTTSDLNKLIFISHSSDDFTQAKLLCDILECSGLRCWIAPRDIPPSASYAREIIRGIESSWAFILLLTPRSNASKHVFREAEIACSRDVPVYPVRLSDIQPSPDLEYLTATTHRFDDAIGSNLEEAFTVFSKKLWEALKSNVGPELPKAELVRFPDLIKYAPYPLSMGIKAVLEQELDPEAAKKESALLSFVEMVARFSTHFLAAAYRDVASVQSSEMDKLLSNFLRGRRPEWAKVLGGLADSLKDRSDAFPIARDYAHFLVNAAGSSAIDQVLCQLAIDPGAPAKSPMLDFLGAVIAYQRTTAESDRCNRDEILPLIRDAITVFLSKCPFSGLVLNIVRSARPNKADQTFVHDVLELKADEIREVETPLITRNWEIYEPSHVVARMSDVPGCVLDLSPFVTANEDCTGIMIWERSDDLVRVQMRGVESEYTKDSSFVADPFLQRLKERSVDYSDDILEAFRNAESFIEKNVTNPVCRRELDERLRIMNEQLNNQLNQSGPVDVSGWINRLDQLRTYASQGSFPRLRPTEHPWLFRDGTGGKYIDTNAYLRENPTDVPKPEDIVRIVGHRVTNDLIVIVRIALMEAARTGVSKPKLRVEHLMIALSKLCNRLVLDWYDAIDVPPKRHRDMTRAAREMIAEKSKKAPSNQEHRLEIGSRTRKIFEWMSEEAKLCGRDEASTADLLSAILREGHSLPICLLTDVHDLPRDRLLGDFYKVLRRSS